MFTGSGFALEKGVRKIFIELGFEILETEDNRDDLIIKSEEKVAVVEIKGDSKSAAAQLEKWAANYV